MGKCFVIQPFDKGRFDKRYEDVFAPAVRAADLEPYRVDKDPSVSIPIEDIEAGIAGSEVCLAEISTDNPNVWFELGYAIASQRDTLLVCSDERTSHFPFDVQHRSIIRYATESPSDFRLLSEQITQRLQAVLDRKARLGEVARMPSVARVEGLEQYEVAALVAVAQQVIDPQEGLSGFRVAQDMEQAGFTKLAANLGLTGLVTKDMLEAFDDKDYDGSRFTAYRVRPQGMAWLRANQDKLTLKQ
jgi:hypothetical protein